MMADPGDILPKEMENILVQSSVEAGENVEDRIDYFDDLFQKESGL